MPNGNDDDIFDKLANQAKAAFNDVVTLKIKTMVDDKVISSEIKLLTGDITTKIDKAFVDGTYEGIREFHADREKQGFEMIRKNIEALKDLFVWATGELKKAAG